jgi:hypothetical protein
MGLGWFEWLLVGGKPAGDDTMSRACSAARITLPKKKLETAW